MISPKEGGIYNLSPNDDFMAAPGLATAFANGGNSVNGYGQTDAFAQQSKVQEETNKTLDKVLSVLTDAPKKTAKYTGQRFNEARNA